MPCGQICKEILDGAAALVQSVTCMGNSLNHLAAGPPPDELRKDFMDKARAAAESAQAIAKWCSASSGT